MEMTLGEWGTVAFAIPAAAIIIGAIVGLAKLMDRVQK